MDVLTSAEIAARIGKVRDRAPQHVVKPLSAAASGLLEVLRIEDGIGLGLVEVDVLTRGFRPTDLVIITGFATSGKTQLVNTMIHANPDKHVLFFSLDDPAEMILAKLVAMETGISSVEWESRVRRGDPDAVEVINAVANDTFKNLLVVDEVLGLGGMQAAVQEATDMWGCPPDAVIIDYLEMMPGNARLDDALASVKAKANDLKRWSKTATFPLIVLHQGTRSNSRPGDPITLLSMGHSGEQQATIVVGCRRKRDRADLDAMERVQHQETITVHVVKNKRPGGRITHYEGIDFHMEPDTGFIRPLQRREAATPTAAVAAAHLVSPQLNFNAKIGGS